MFTEETFPKIISVDDHIMEPANVWQDRLPAKFKEVGPRLVRLKVAEMSFVGGVFSYREARGRRRHVVRLVAHRGPPLPAGPAHGRRGLPA